jgi:hypothetical protein
MNGSKNGDDDNAVKDLLDLIYAKKDASQSKSELYQQLMAKEERVLNTVDRVVNVSQKLELERQLFVNSSVHQIWQRTLQLIPQIMQDITTMKTPLDVGPILLRDDRKIYVGLIIVGAALLAFFASVI